MAPVLGPKAKQVERVDFRYRGKPELLREIEAAAAEQKISRNEAITQLLRYALDAHYREAKRGAKK